MRPGSAPISGRRLSRAPCAEVRDLPSHSGQQLPQPVGCSGTSLLLCFHGEWVFQGENTVLMSPALEAKL